MDTHSQIPRLPQIRPLSAFFLPPHLQNIHPLLIPVAIPYDVPGWGGFPPPYDTNSPRSYYPICPSYERLPFDCPCPLRIRRGLQSQFDEQPEKEWTNAQCQQWFVRNMILCYGYTYKEAIRKARKLKGNGKRIYRRRRLDCEKFLGKAAGRDLWEWIHQKGEYKDLIVETVWFEDF